MPPCLPLRNAQHGLQTLALPVFSPKLALKLRGGTCLQGSLRLGLQLLLSEEAYSVAGLRPAVGRLANAMVALLGPELSPGSMAYDTCKSLIREMQVRCAANGWVHPSLSSLECEI